MVNQEKQWYELVDNDWVEHFVDLDTGIKMCYLTMGPEDGKPVILIHGATDSRISFSQVAPIVAEAGYRVYVPELRGHGKSDKPVEEDDAYTVAEHTADIISFMDKVDIEKADITGHSLGTFIAQELAIVYPQSVTSITLIATGAKVEGNEALTWCYYGDGESYLGVHGYDEEQAMPEDFIKDWTSCANEDENFNKALYLHALALPYTSWSQTFGGLLQLDNRERLASITCPVQIIWGTEDTLFLAEDQEEIKTTLVNASQVNYVEIEGAAHNTHWESKAIAKQVADLVIDWATK